MTVKHAYAIDITHPVVPWALGRDIVRGDANSHVIEVTLTDGGEVVDLANVTAMLYVVRPDGNTVDYAMNITGNVVSVAMPPEASAIAGRIYILVRVTVNDETLTVLYLYTTVRNGITDVLVDPGDTIPTLDVLLAKLGAMEAATIATQHATEGALDATEGANQAGRTAENAAEAANQAAAAIDGLTASAESVPHTSPASAAIQVVDGHKDIHIEVPGGKPYTILGGPYDTVADLTAAIPSPAIGDQYTVGTVAPYHIYRWGKAQGQSLPGWLDDGVLQGPEGPPGPAGQDAVPRQTFVIDLPAEDWSSTAPFEQNVTVEDMTADTDFIVDVILSDTLATAIDERKSYAYIDQAEGAEGSITFTCLTVRPIVDLTLQARSV